MTPQQIQALAESRYSYPEIPDNWKEDEEGIYKSLKNVIEQRRSDFISGFNERINTDPLVKLAQDIISNDWYPRLPTPAMRLTELNQLARTALASIEVGKQEEWMKWFKEMPTIKECDTLDASILAADPRKEDILIKDLRKQINQMTNKIRGCITNPNPDGWTALFTDEKEYGEYLKWRRIVSE